MQARRLSTILVLVLVVLSNVFVPVISPAIAATGTTDEVLLRRIVVASIDEKEEASAERNLGNPDDCAWSV